MWFIFALITSLSNACYFICNQKSRLPTDIFMVYRGLLIALAVTPLMLICPHVFPWQFYAIAFLQALAISFYDSKMFVAFHRFGAQNVNSIQPLTVAITFCGWLLIRPQTIQLYLATPLRSLLIICALGGIIFAVMKYRQSRIGLDSLKFVLPLLFVSALIDTSNKIIMEYADGYLLTASIYRIGITGWLIGSINLWRILGKKVTLKQIFNWQNLCGSLFLGLLILSMIGINFSLYYAMNPAYTFAIIYSSILWIILINKIRVKCGYSVEYENIEKKWILLLLCSAIILIISA